jgi:DNA invertase Pin-like site-specific DNA recombinase
MKVLKAAIYTRVSSADQHPEMQRSELVEYVKRRGWSLYKEYSDKMSGEIERRPALDALFEDITRSY